MNKKNRKRKQIETTCEYCKINFHKDLSEYKRSENLGRKHFCSLECSQSFKKPKDKKCSLCGEVIPYDKRENRYCSKSCRSKVLIASNQKMRGKKKNFSDKGIANIIEASKKRYNTNEKRTEYLKNPNICKNCDNIIPYEKRRKIFCNNICRREYDRKNMDEYKKYKSDTRFKFNLSDYPNEFDFTLIEEYGWYRPSNRGNNLNGVSRDHMYSVREGFENNIDPEIISHPANCKLLVHTNNISKNKNSSINIDELLLRIELWNIKYNE